MHFFLVALVAGVTSVYGGVLPSTNVENANQEVYLGTFASNPEIDFHTNMIQVFKLIDPTGDQACLWISQPVTLSIIKLDQNQFYISYTIGYQEFLGVTMNMDGSSTTSRILDGSVEVAANVQKNITAEVLSGHLRPATSALTVSFAFLPANGLKNQIGFPTLTINLDLIFSTNTTKRALEMVAVMSLNGGDAAQVIRGEMHFQRDPAAAY